MFNFNNDTLPFVRIEKTSPNSHEKNLAIRSILKNFGSYNSLKLKTRARLKFEFKKII